MVLALGWFYFTEGMIWRWGWREVEKIRIQLHTLFPVPSLRSHFLDHCRHAKGFLLSLFPPRSLPSLSSPPSLHAFILSSLSLFLWWNFFFLNFCCWSSQTWDGNACESELQSINFLLFSVLFHSHRLSHVCVWLDSEGPDQAGPGRGATCSSKTCFSFEWFGPWAETIKDWFQKNRTGSTICSLSFSPACFIFFFKVWSWETGPAERGIP